MSDENKPGLHDRDNSECMGTCASMCAWCLVGHECPEACGGGAECPYLDMAERECVVHDVKAWCEPFAALWSKVKRHEVRVNDRGYQVGDILMQREWHAVELRYTGRWIRHRVTYMTEGGEWGIPEHLCVMSIQEIERSE